MLEALDTEKPCLGRTEIQYQVEQHRKVVIVIGYVEIEYLFLLAFLFGYERNPETVILDILVGLGAFLSTVDYMLWLNALACGNLEGVTLPFLQ